MLGVLSFGAFLVSMFELAVWISRYASHTFIYLMGGELSLFQLDIIVVPPASPSPTSIPLYRAHRYKRSFPGRDTSRFYRYACWSVALVSISIMMRALFHARRLYLGLGVGG